MIYCFFFEKIRKLYFYMDNKNNKKILLLFTNKKIIIVANCCLIIINDNWRVWKNKIKKWTFYKSTCSDRAETYFNRFFVSF